MLFMIKCCSQDNCASWEEFIFPICTLLSCYSLQRLNVQEDATITSDLKKLTPSYSGETTYDTPVTANGILSHYTLLVYASCLRHFCASGPNWQI